MRALPVTFSNRSFVQNSKNAHKKIENSNPINNIQNNTARKYTGVASRDLAYVSMFDNAIARDLKLMGLI